MSKSIVMLSMCILLAFIPSAQAAESVTIRATELLPAKLADETVRQEKAGGTTDQAPGNCKTQENATVSISFSSTESDPAKVKTAMGDKISAITALAKEKNLQKADVQSSSFSLYLINNGNGGCNAASGGQLQFSGNVNLIVEPADQAADFMTFLIEKGYNANMNFNSYRQCE